MYSASGTLALLCCGSCMCDMYYYAICDISVLYHACVLYNGLHFEYLCIFLFPVICDLYLLYIMHVCYICDLYLLYNILYNVLYIQIEA